MPQWCKKVARNIETGAVTTCDIPEIVLIGIDKKDEEHYDDSSDES